MQQFFANARTRRLADFGVDWNALAQSAGGAAISRVVFDSNLLPQISIDDPFGANPAASSDGGGTAFTQKLTDAFLRLLKPKITADTAAGPISISPFGEPHDPSYWPFVSVGLLVIGALAAYGAVKLVRGGK